MMSFSHLRQRRRVSLLAAGVLEGGERESALAHLEACPECRREYQELCAVVAALERDPLRSAEPELPVAVLAARVERELERTLSRPDGKQRLWLVALPAAAAVLALSVIVPMLVERFRGGERPQQATLAPAASAPVASEQALRRIESSLAREQAARYLNDAGDVLVAVTASELDCNRKDGRLDVGAAPERSRELLQERQLVEAGGEAVASARFVLDDVEMALRDVAELPPCVKRQEVERVRRQIERRQLLMRIRLMTRELEG